MSDCANVIRFLKEEAMRTYEHVIRKIKSRKGNFQAFEFVHEGREENFEGHRFARSYLGERSGRHVWLVELPDDVCTHISVSLL